MWFFGHMLKKKRYYLPITCNFLYFFPYKNAKKCRFGLEFEFFPWVSEFLSFFRGRTKKAWFNDIFSRLVSSPSVFTTQLLQSKIVHESLIYFLTSFDGHRIGWRRIHPFHNSPSSAKSVRKGFSPPTRTISLRQFQWYRTTNVLVLGQM